MHQDDIAAHIMAHDELWASLTSCHLTIIDPFLIYRERLYQIYRERLYQQTGAD